MKHVKIHFLSALLLSIPFIVANAESKLATVDENGEYTSNVNDELSNSDDENSYNNSSHDTTDVAKSDSNAEHPRVYAYNDSAYDNDSDEDQDNSYFDTRYKKYAYNTPEYRETGGHSLFIFDPNSHRWTAYNSSGELVGSGRASGGKGFCPDIHSRCMTPVGSFRVYSMGGPGCVSTKFPVGRGGAPMPYCMFFHGGFAIHGSNDVPNHNASHGCIRVEPSAARWLQENVISYGTRVVVKPY
jgi:hypothetical protein